MVMRVFIDTNVMLDFLAKRQPHFFAAERLLSLAFEREIQIIASSLSFITSHYILGKHGFFEAEIRKLLKNMCAVCEVVKIDQGSITYALNSTFADMEDGVQHLCALEAKADVIVTRDEKDFKTSQLAVMNPNEFISWYLSSLKLSPY